MRFKLFVYLLFVGFWLLDAKAVTKSSTTTPSTTTPNIDNATRPAKDILLHSPVAYNQGAVLKPAFPAVVKIRAKTSAADTEEDLEKDVLTLANSLRHSKSFSGKKGGFGSSYGQFLVEREKYPLTGDPYASGFRGLPESQVGSSNSYLGAITKAGRGTGRNTFGSYGSVDSVKGQMSVNRAGTGSSPYQTGSTGYGGGTYDLTGQGGSSFVSTNNNPFTGYENQESTSGYNTGTNNYVPDVNNNFGGYKNQYGTQGYVTPGQNYGQETAYSSQNPYVASVGENYGSSSSYSGTNYPQAEVNSGPTNYGSQMNGYGSNTADNNYGTTNQNSGYGNSYYVTAPPVVNGGDYSPYEASNYNQNIDQAVNYNSYGTVSNMQQTGEYGTATTGYGNSQTVKTDSGSNDNQGSGIMTNSGSNYNQGDYGQEKNYVNTVPQTDPYFSRKYETFGESKYTPESFVDNNNYESSNYGTSQPTDSNYGQYNVGDQSANYNSYGTQSYGNYGVPDAVSNNNQYVQNTDYGTSSSNYNTLPQTNQANSYGGGSSRVDYNIFGNTPNYESSATPNYNSYGTSAGHIGSSSSMNGYSSNGYSSNGYPDQNTGYQQTPTPQGYGVDFSMNVGFGSAMKDGRNTNTAGITNNFPVLNTELDSYRGKSR